MPRIHLDGESKMQIDCTSFEINEFGCTYTVHTPIGDDDGIHVSKGWVKTSEIINIQHDVFKTKDNA